MAELQIPPSLPSPPASPKPEENARITELTHHIRSITMLLSLITPYNEDVFIPPPVNPTERRLLRAMDEIASLFTIDLNHTGGVCIAAKTTIPGASTKDVIEGKEIHAPRAKGTTHVYVSSTENDADYMRRKMKLGGFWLDGDEEEERRKSGEELQWQIGERKEKETVEHLHVNDCFGECWMDCYLKNGPYAIKPHSKTLEILGNLMINSTAQEDKSKLLTSLTNFTLLQFQPKILQRLEIKLHASSATAFLDLFREEAEGGLKRKDLEDGFLELPYVGVGKGGFNEGKLRPVWRKCGIKDFAMTEDGKIKFCKDTIAQFHQFLSRLMGNYHDLVKKLGNFRIPNPRITPEKLVERRADLQHLLLDVTLYTRALIDLCTKSRTFTRYINQRPIKRFISLHALESRLGPLLIPKQLKEHLEDDQTLPYQKAVIATPHTTLALYLRNITTPLLSLLDSLPLMRFPVNIHLLSWLPNPEDQFHQSSLPSLMGSVLTGREIDDVDTVLHRIGTRAEHKCRKTFRAEAENQGKWRRPEMLVKENWGQWEGGFGGGWHPLSLVVCGKTLEAMGGPEGGKLLGGRDQGGIYGLLGLGKNTQHLLGTSKQCCYTCYIYLTLCCPHPKFKNKPACKISGCSGRFIPWSPPPHETRIEVLQQIWDHLKDVLIRHLTEMYLLPSADESDASALEGSSDEEVEAGVGAKGAAVGYGFEEEML